VAGEKKKEQGQPDQAVIHSIAASALKRFRSATPLFRPRNLEAETLHVHVLRVNENAFKLSPLISCGAIHNMEERRA
jgi:hypothetical protein